MPLSGEAKGMALYLIFDDYKIQLSPDAMPIAYVTFRLSSRRGSLNF